MPALRLWSSPIQFLRRRRWNIVPKFRSDALIYAVFFLKGEIFLMQSVDVVVIVFLAFKTNKDLASAPSWHPVFCHSRSLTSPWSSLRPSAGLTTASRCRTSSATCPCNQTRGGKATDNKAGLLTKRTAGAQTIMSVTNIDPTHSDNDWGTKAIKATNTG